MIFFFHCDRHKPECCDSYSCGVECTETFDITHSEISKNPPSSLEELETRFNYVGEITVDGQKHTIWEEKERSISFS